MLAKQQNALYISGHCLVQGWQTFLPVLWQNTVIIMNMFLAQRLPKAPDSLLRETQFNFSAVYVSKVLTDTGRCCDTRNGVTIYWKHHYWETKQVTKNNF